MAAAFNDSSVLDRSVTEVMDPPLQAIGVGEPVSVAVERLEHVSALLVLDGGHAVGVVTRADLLSFLAQSVTAG
jgi:cystathionine beta-synthase